MTRSGRQRGERRHRPTAPSSRERPQRKIAPEKRKAAGRPGPRAGGWLQTKRPVLRFVLLLAGFIALFNVFFYLWLVKSDFFEGYLNINAKATAVILNLFGENARATGSSVSGRYSVQIRMGCDALQSSVFFAFAVLASPSRFSLMRKLPVMLVGTGFFLLLNLVRIVSLYYTGIWYPRAFDAMHLDVWQPVFIFLPLILWVIWARGAMRSRPKKRDVHP